MSGAAQEHLSFAEKTSSIVVNPWIWLVYAARLAKVFKPGV